MLCAACEKEAKRAEKLGLRVARLRIGLVLGSDGGLLKPLMRDVQVRPRAGGSAAGRSGCRGSISRTCSALISPGDRRSDLRRRHQRGRAAGR
jgi:hypothetical protein